MEPKACSTCGRTLPAGDFYVDSTKRSGLSSACRECVKARSSKWYWDNHERGLATRKGYYESHKDELLTDQLRRRLMNPERWAGYQATYRQRHAEEKRSYNAWYRINFPDRVMESNRRYYWANKDEILRKTREHQRLKRDHYRAKLREWRLNNPDRVVDQKGRRRARELGQAPVPIGQAALRARWDYYAGRCWLCGEPADSWDHVKPLSRGGLHAASNLRPSCMSCNSRKSARWPLSRLP